MDSFHLAHSVHSNATVLGSIFSHNITVGVCVTEWTGVHEL